MKLLLDTRKTLDAKAFRYRGLLILLHPEVYEPCEDTFLLLESLDVQAKETVLELGMGCGVIALHCASVGAPVVCSDVNPFAVTLTKQNYVHNKSLLKATVDVRHGDLFSSITKEERFDVIVFNPPYLPTEKHECVGGWFDVATDGGCDGLVVTKRFIKGCHRHLKQDGRVFFVSSSLCDQSEVQNALKKGHFTFSIVATQRFEGEDLFVYRAAPTD